MLKLYGSLMSGNTLAVLTTLKEKNIAFKFISINLKTGEQKLPEHVERQPFGQVPYIEDEGFGLYETRAICRYICSKYPEGPALVPTGNLKETALFEQACSIESFNFNPHVSAIMVERFLKPMLFGAPTNEAAVASSLATLESRLAVYETILSKQKYLAGDEFTLADLLHLAPGHFLAVRAHVDVLESGRYPAVTSWWTNITARPSWKAVLAEASAAGPPPPSA